MAPSIVFDEYAVIGGVNFGGRAAWVESYASLLEDPPTVGENVHIPGFDGRTGYGKDQDELRITLVVNVDGDYNFANDSISSNPRQQVLVNREYLRANLGTSSLPIGDGTVNLVWHQYDGGTVHVSVQVLGLIGWTYLAPTFARSTLDLIVPAGALDAVGS